MVNKYMRKETFQR